MIKQTKKKKKVKIKPFSLEWYMDYCADEIRESEEEFDKMIKSLANKTKDK